MVIYNSGGTLEVNASWSGSRVTDTHTDPTYPDFYDRTGEDFLGTPDVIFVALGSNDASHDVALGDYDFTTSYENLSESTFRTAYIKGIKALQANYSSADIICLAEIMGDEYKESIEFICQTLGVEFIDVRGYDSNEVLKRHPNAHGMQQIASWVMFPTDKDLWEEHYPADAKAVGEAISEILQTMVYFDSEGFLCFQSLSNV